MGPTTVYAGEKRRSMLTEKGVAWLINRLRSMGPAEIISRLADVGRHLTLCTSLNQVKRRSQQISVGNGYQGFKGPVLSRGQLDGIPEQVGEDIIAIADEWLTHRASFFGLRDIPLGDRIDWHRDYSSNVIGPRKYSGLIDHRDITRVGNIKYIWELNRLQHLVVLAAAWLLTGNDAYGEEIEKQVLSWTTNNPFMTGVNWKSPLEAGIRLISLAYVSFLTAGLNEGKEIYRKALQETIYEHQYFIRKFYSKHSSANNHLIGEMAGLYVGSVFWPGYKESAAWRAFARKKLIEESSRQVEADGVGRERSTEYQLFTLEFFILAGALGQTTGDPFPNEYWERLRRMVTFLSAVSDRAGNLPMFGDGDGGQAVWLTGTTPERCADLVQIRQFREGAGVISNLRSALLLWGQEADEMPVGPLPSSVQSLQAFHQGGYYVMATDRGGEDEMVVVFDAGPLGLPPLYAHGHADALNFWLSYRGKEFFIDPGTFCYSSPALWRSYFRGTAAHNTVRIDGADQSIAVGPFLWRHVTHCEAEHLEENDEFVEVEGFHDGYQRLADPVIHRRRIRLSKKSKLLTVIDRVECKEAHDIELFFHFSEKCHVKPDGSNCFHISNGNRHLRLRLLDPRLRSELYRGCENPIAGWVSRTFDIKEPSFTLVARARIAGSTQFLAEIAAL